MPVAVFTGIEYAAHATRKWPLTRFPIGFYLPTAGLVAGSFDVRLRDDIGC